MPSEGGASTTSNNNYGSRRRQDLSNNRLENAVPMDEDGQGDNWLLWGTTVNVAQAQRKFNNFFRNFKKNGVVLYPRLVEEAITQETRNINVDAQNVHEFDKDLY